MPTLGDFTISIIDPVTGAPFEEYKVSETPKTTECYIESEAEKPFGISGRLNDQSLGDSEVCYSMKVWVDGKYIRSTLFGRIPNKDWTKSVIYGADIGPEEFVPFVFGATHFTGDLVSLQQANIYRGWPN
jgi:hypothetical protein